MKHVIVAVMTEDMEVGHNRPATLTLKIVEKVFVVMR